MQAHRTCGAWMLGGVLPLVAAGACGGGHDDLFSQGAGFVDGRSASGATGFLTDPNAAGVPAGCSLPPDARGCVGEEYQGESIPLDIYVMFDLSCSMSCTVNESGCCGDALESEWRIQAVREAMRSFLRDPASNRIGVGLGFFGDHSTNQRNDPEVCTVEAHSDATVEIERLPDSAGALIAVLDAARPQGGTPTNLAIEGACTYVSDWKAENPGHKVVILLVTDGIPEAACGANLGLTTVAAERCFDGGQGFETYVLGVVANNNNALEKLNEIAESGGTERAYLTDSADVRGSVLAALNAIRADAVIPCDLQISEPSSGAQLEYDSINLGICDGSRQAVVTPRVTNAGACANGAGWYFDDPSSPETIHLCDATCETVSNPGSSLFFSIGCGAIIQ